MKKSTINYAEQRVINLMRKDFCALQESLTVGDALEYIRRMADEPKILYFYIVDAQQHLLGVVSTRKLLTSGLDLRLIDICDRQVKSVPDRAEVMDVLTDFVVHKYLAMPVVDAEHRIIGMIDVSVFTDNVSDILERERADDVFETIGFRISQIQGASPLKAFSFRFPWLLASMAGGFCSALMASYFENVLAVAIVLSFFLTLVLGLGESVSMQSMTVTIQALRIRPPSLKWFVHEFIKELGTAVLLGLACGLVVGLTVWLWRGELLPAIVIGSSLLLSLTSACLTGLAIPTLLHALKLDPKIAAGPLALTISDLFTIVIYFGFASLVLLP
ncbi:MAG TPA: magnesium transporter [Candidatus Cloacimonadota bacterium]|mgnify:FL=1|nr:magnesium transporter [Candidatus Cloacimonadota bacterium]